MTEPGSTSLSLPASVGVVNVGLPLFGDAVAEQGAPVIAVDWRVPAGGQPAAVAALDRLYGIHAERVEAANAEVIRRLDQGIPLLTGITTVASAVPGLPGRALLHCGPAIGYADAPDPLRRSMQAAAVAEGWAASPAQADGLLGREEIGLSPANAHRVVLPMATALGPSAPLYVLTNEAGGTIAYAPVSQGPGEVAWFGCATTASIARLVFLREVAAPVIRQILERATPLDVLALAAQAIAMGDDVHVRTQAATNLLIREWLPQLAEMNGQDATAFARFLAGNHLFFLTLAMGAARSLTEWAGQVEGSSIVTSMARNGTTFGIRLARLGPLVPRRCARGGPRPVLPRPGPGDQRQGHRRQRGAGAVRARRGGRGRLARGGPAPWRPDERGGGSHRAARCGVRRAVEPVQDPGAGQHRDPAGGGRPQGGGTGHHPRGDHGNPAPLRRDRPGRRRRGGGTAGLLR